jgi:hypothetical protein
MCLESMNTGWMGKQVATWRVTRMLPQQAGQQQGAGQSAGREAQGSSGQAVGMGRGQQSQQTREAGPGARQEKPKKVV